MKTSEIIDALNAFGIDSVDHDKVLSAISFHKSEFLKCDNQQQLKGLWICEQIVLVHKLYLEAFDLIKSHKYYDGWQKLERVEITLLHLKKHYSFPGNECNLLFVEKQVIRFQKIYPYKMFFSSELLEKEKECTICGKKVNIRKPCGHKVGEIYNGEMCGRIITKVDFLGAALVTNPVNKYSVCFVSSDENGERKDYRYEALDYLTEHIDDPYEFWDVEIEMKPLPADFFSGVQLNDLCPCGSEEKYNMCCSTTPKDYMHHTFILNKPSSKTVIA